MEGRPRGTTNGPIHRSRIRYPDRLPLLVGDPRQLLQPPLGQAQEGWDGDDHLRLRPDDLRPDRLPVRGPGGGPNPVRVPRHTPAATPTAVPPHGGQSDQGGRLYADRGGERLP